MIIVWLTTLLAHAVDPSPWFGSWVLDPIQSDDPAPRVEQSLRAPMLAATGARQMAADGGQIDSDDQMRRVRTAAMDMLSRSGQLRIAPAGDVDTMTVQLAGEDAVALTLGRKWTKVKRASGTLRLRAQLADGPLVIQRREKNLTVTEAFLVPSSPGQVAVVVTIDGSGLDEVEFRRVYRALPDEPADGAPSDQER